MASFFHVQHLLKHYGRCIRLPPIFYPLDYTFAPLLPFTALIQKLEKTMDALQGDIMLANCILL